MLDRLAGRYNAIDVATALQAIIEAGKASTYEEAYNLYLKGEKIEKKKLD